MRLSKVNPTTTSTSMISTWRGFNKNVRTNDGEFFDMKNMTSDNFPVLSPRDKRGIVSHLTNCTGLSATDKLYWCDDNKFYYDTHYICDLSETDDKQFVQMGAYICIFPDKIAYNTFTDEIIELESEFESDTVAMTLCKMDGTSYDYTKMWIGSVEPEDREAYPYWLDLSSSPAVLKLYSSNESRWVSVPTVYVKMTAIGIGDAFNEDDAVTISGCDIEDFNTSMIVQTKGDDFIVVIGLLEAGIVINSKTMRFERKLPQLDYVCELNNRLWGCSANNHEIYGSKQGDPTNWNYFSGLSSDSYAATVGTNGRFTGCIAHYGSVLFFKERGVHKLYGSQPSNFTMSWTELEGVQEGSEKSLVSINEYLYYKSVNGICAFNGTTPTNISRGLGTDTYYDARAGKFLNKYYVSMRDKDYNWSLYVYDTERQLWHKEDDIRAAGFADYEGACYMVDQNNIMWVFPTEKIEQRLFPGMDWEDIYYFPSEEIFPGYIATSVYEDDVEWSVTTSDIGLDNPFEKYISRIVMRLSMEEGAELNIEIMYNADGIWNKLLNLRSDDLRSYNVPLRVERCDHFRLRLSGVKKTMIYSMAEVIETGSEL